MLCLSDFELYSRWVPLYIYIYIYMNKWKVSNYRCNQSFEVPCLKNSAN